MAAPMALVATYADRNKARAAQSRLEEAGIPSTLVDAGPAPYSQSQAGMRLLVVSHLCTKAKEILGINPIDPKVLGLKIAMILIIIPLVIELFKNH